MIKILILCIFFVITSCSKDKESSRRVKFSFTNFPQALHESKTGHMIYDKSTQPVPTTFADINCFAIMAVYPELEPINSCDFLDGSFWESPDDIGGLAPFPGDLFMDVKMGPSRRFHVIGFQSDTYCPDAFSDWGPIDTLISEPFLMGTVDSVDVGLLTEVVNINISSSFLSYEQIGECIGPLFNWGDEMGAPNCGASPGYASIDAEWIGCNYSSMDSYYVDLSEITTSHEFLVVTSSGQYAKLQVVAINATSIGFNYEVFDMSDGASLYTGTVAAATFDVANAYIDIDQNGATGHSTMMGNDDLHIFNLGASYYLVPLTSDGHKLVAGHTLNGEVAKLRFIESPFGQEDLLDMTLKTNGTCIPLKVAAFDRANNFRPINTAISVALIVRGPGGIFYSDSGCSASITTIGIGATIDSSDIFYYKHPDTGSWDAVFNATDSTTDLEGAFQPTVWDD